MQSVLLVRQVELQMRQQHPREANCIQPVSIITFHVNRRRHEMCGGHGRLCARVCVCLSLTTCPQYCTDAVETWGMVGVPTSCAVFGGFADGARVSLL